MTKALSLKLPIFSKAFSPFMLRLTLFYLLMLLSSLQLKLKAQAPHTLPVSFTSSGYRLQGKLLKPRTEHNVPALIFLPGSGTASYRHNYVRFVREVLEVPFAQEVALLYFDKRGIAPSEGKWHTASFNDRAVDVLQAIRFLKTQPGIDTTRIGVIGHSQGGWIAQLVAAQYPQEVAFGISLAGPTFSVFEQVVQDCQSELMCKGVPAGKARRKALRKIKTAFALSGPLGLFSKSLRQLHVIRNFSPEQTIANISIPFLFMFAENDPLVYPEVAEKELQDIFTGQLPANLDYVTIAGSNHAFLLAEPCHKGSWSALQYSGAFQQYLKSWLYNTLELEAGPK